MTDDTKSGVKVSSGKSSPQGRSPGYPFLPLGKALERAQQLKEHEGFYAVPLTSAYKAWGISEKSSSTPQVVAALKYFGLIDYEGSGQTRSIKLTDLARRIILDVRPDSPDKPKLIKQAAMTPMIHQEVVRAYPDGLPSDTTLQTYLVLNKGFNETGARALISELRDTLRFSNITLPGNIPTPETGEDCEDPLRLAGVEVEVGDLVNAEVGGVLAFPNPKRVRAVQEGWVFVEDSESGVRMENVEIVEKAQIKRAAEPPVPRLPLPKNENQKEEPDTRVLRFALKEGDVVITFPENLSADSVEDLDGYWQVFLKRARREAASETKH